MNPRAVVPALALLLAFAVCPPAHGQGPFPDLWRWAHFTTTDGLPSNFATAVIEVPGDGLWTVTRTGLARFDGYRWQPVVLPGRAIDPEAIVVGAPIGAQGTAGVALSGSAAVRPGVLVISSGRLFAGSAGRLERVPGLDPRVMFVAAARAGNGRVLLLSRDGALYDWSAGTCRLHGPPPPLGRVFSLLQAGPRMVWVAAERGVFCWDGTSWRMRLRTGPAPVFLTAAFELDDESAWAYIDRPAEARGLWHWGPGSSRPERGTVPSPIIALSRTRGGHLLAVHATGDLAVNTGGDRWTAIATGALTLDVRSVSTLDNGDAVLSTDQGIFLYRASSDRWTIRTFPPPDEANSINELALGPDGTLWLGTSHGICVLRPDRRLERLPPGAEALKRVTGLAFDRQGRLWASSGESFPGVRWLDASGWHRLAGDPLLEQSYIHRVVTDREGGVWFLGLTTSPNWGNVLPADGPGAFRLGPDGRVTRWGQAEGLPSGRVYAFGEGPDGAYWFGTMRGLSRYRQGTWRHWTMADGLRAARIFTLSVDDLGTVWFGHQFSGVGKLQSERVSYVPPQQGLGGDAVWTVRADHQGRVWVATEGGVSLFEHGRWTELTGRTGLPKRRVWPVWPEANRVYIGTAGGGLAMLKLSDPAPPPVVNAGRVLVERDAALVSWTAASWWAELPSEAIPTRLQLDEGPWTDWTTEREHRFASLGPGTHRVRVQAKGLLGTPGPVSRPIAVVIAPPLFRRPAVYLPITGLALVIVGLVGLLGLRQRQHRLALLEREQLFTKVFRASPLPAVLTALEDGQCVDLNGAFERLLGRPREELLGRTVEDIGLLDGNFERDALKRSLKEHGALRGMPVKVRQASGEPLDVLAYLEVFEIDGRPSILTQLIDVTEQRRLEAQLRQAQKMESVGRLAGGVAHDFNNLLTVILGNAALVDAAFTPGDPRREEVDQIKIAGERAERLTRQLLAFARKQVVEPRVVSINDVVLRTDRMLRRLIGEDIELVTITPEVWPAFIDPGQLEQVLLNMAVNARDAMPGGGKLTISTSNIVVKEGDPDRDPDTAPGEYVRLSIADSGVGMDAATAARVFDPFFTTKDAGKGTGLGLAMCYGIVKQAGGQILVQTTPGQGTTFLVDLPHALQRVEGTETRDRAADMPGGRETILLVEDEVQVRRLAAAVLRRRGYEVLEAPGGPEALQLSREYHGRIDALVTDVVMPQMRGTEVARAFKAIRPDVKVLYMSGYTDDDRFQQETGNEAFAFLAKPFTPTTLARRLREVLDAGV